MIQIEEQKLCQLCKERALGSKERFTDGVFEFERIRRWAFTVAVIGIACAVAFRIYLRYSITKGLRDDVPVAEMAAAEPWAAKEPSDWPTILLEPTVESESAEWRASGNAFLIQKPDGAVIAATALIHVPTTEPNPSPQRAGFKKWHLTGADKSPIELTETLPTADAACEMGVLLAHSKLTESTAPANPLRLRSIGYGKNMKMKVLVRASSGNAPTALSVSVRDTESAGGDRIYTIEKNLISGRERVVSVSGDGGASLFEFDHPVKVDDVVGAPVIDAFGHLAAIVTGPEHGKTRDGTARRVRGFGMTALDEALGVKDPQLEK